MTDAPQRRDGPHEDAADGSWGSLTRQVPAWPAAIAIAAAVVVCGALVWWGSRPAQRSSGSVQAEWVDLADQVKALARQGRHAEAIRASRASLELAEGAFGPSHPAMAEAWNDLAQSLVAAGELEGVEPMYARAIEIQSRIAGPDSVEVAGVVNNLALALQKLSRFDEAERLFQRVWSIYDGGLEPGHPWRATALNNLACLEDARGRHDAAQPLHERALALRERYLGPAHPDTAESLANLAVNAFERDASAEAEPLQRRALAIRERALGPSHPVTAASLVSLSAILRIHGSLDDAEWAALGGLAIRQQAFGLDHVLSAGALEAVAEVRAARGDVGSARDLFERAVAIRLRSGGVSLKTAVAIDRLLDCGAAADVSAEAFAARRHELLEAAGDIRARVLGENHRETQEALRRLADAAHASGDVARATEIEARIAAAVEAATAE